MFAGPYFHSMLELGCSTGKNTPFFAQTSGRSDVVDFSDGMIAQAQEKVRSDRVKFTADLSLASLCADLAFDLISCNLVLEHIRDFPVIFLIAAHPFVDAAVAYGFSLDELPTPGIFQLLKE